MVVDIPPGTDRSEIERLVDEERRYSHELQRAGTWIGLWRVVGRWANYSIFDVETSDQLHDILTSLPLFPYLTIEVVPLARHPSWLGD